MEYSRLNQQSQALILLINVKMPTIVNNLSLMSRKILCSIEMNMKFFFYNVEAWFHTNKIWFTDVFQFLYHANIAMHYAEILKGCKNDNF